MLPESVIPDFAGLTRRIAEILLRAFESREEHWRFAKECRRVPAWRNTRNPGRSLSGGRPKPLRFLFDSHGKTQFRRAVRQLAPGDDPLATAEEHCNAAAPRHAGSQTQNPFLYSIPCRSFVARLCQPSCHKNCSNLIPDGKCKSRITSPIHKGHNSIFDRLGKIGPPIQEDLEISVMESVFGINCVGFCATQSRKRRFPRGFLGLFESCRDHLLLIPNLSRVCVDSNGSIAPVSGPQRYAFGSKRCSHALSEPLAQDTPH